MFEKFKAFAGRLSSKAKRVAALVSAGAITAIMTVCASAEDGATSASSGMQSIINNAGATLKDEFTTLVSTLVPVLIGIAVVGLSLYACIYLFKMAKKFFSKAAG